MASASLDIDYFDDKFKQTVEELLSKCHIPGMSIAVVDGDKISAEGFGFARLPDVPATPDTLYHIGSTTKAMLAAATGCVIEESRNSNTSESQADALSWTTKIKSILKDDFILEDAYATENITIEDCLSHRTGMSGSDYWYGNWLGSDPLGIVQKLRYLGPLNKLFRASFQYNNLLYSTVGAAMEKVTGLTCSQLMNKYIFKPLKMTSTFWTLEEIMSEKKQENVQRLARGYYWVDRTAKDTPQFSSSADNNGFYVPDAYLQFAGIAPAGSVVSTVNDHAKWLQALLRAAGNEDKESGNESEEKRDNLHISRKLFEELTTPRSYEQFSWKKGRNTHLTPKGYSLGWFHPPAFAGLNHPIINHAGGLTGFGAQAFILPNDNFACVTLANTEMISNYAGERLCCELISKKLGFNDEEKIAFSAAMNPEFPNPEDGESVHSGDSNFAFGREVNEENLAKLEGIYVNPAYGKFQVERCPVDPVEMQVVKSLFVSSSDRDYRDNLRGQGKSLLVSPLDQRTWNWVLLLHPQIQKSSSRKQDSERVKDPNVVFMDSEFLNKHGNAEDDKIPLPTDEPPENDQTKKNSAHWRKEQVWTGSFIKWNSNGAVFRLGSGETGEHIELGIRLINAYVVTEGRQAPGYEKEMIWFKKAS